VVVDGPFATEWRRRQASEKLGRARVRYRSAGIGGGEAELLQGEALPVIEEEGSTAERAELAESGNVVDADVSCCKNLLLLAVVIVENGILIKSFGQTSPC
jgi:hypothetical protein